MARTLVNGAEQIASGSIPWSGMVSGPIVPIGSLVNSSLAGQFIVGGAGLSASWTTLGGDVSAVAGSGAVTISAIGGKSVTLGGALNTGGALTVSGSFSTTLTVTGATSLTLPTSGTVTAQGNTVTGSGALVLANSATLVTPNLGTPSAVNLANATGLPVGALTGTLSVLHGGTGATTAAAAFDALSPLTTAGDIVYGGASGTGTRLGAGTGSQVLIGGSAPSWGSVNLSTMASGTLQAAQSPAYVGDMTSASGSLSTVVGAIGGKAVTLGGTLTTNGAFNLGLTLSANTNLSLPSSGTVTAQGNTVTGSGAIALATGPTLTAAIITLNADPSAALGAATKQYVDNAVQGLSAKPAATVATTAPLAANTYNNGAGTITFTAVGVNTVDGHAAALNDTILVKDEVTGSHNGLYVVTTAGTASVAGVWTRSVAMNVGTEFPSAYVFVEAGTTNSGSGWVCTNTAGSVTVGTTAITFVQFSGSGGITSLSPISVTGNQISITPSAITYSFLQNEGPATILGNPSGSSASPSEISLGSTLAFVSGALQTAALTGDATTSANSFATTVSKIGGKAVTLGGAFTISGAFATTLNVTGATTLTLPTSGTVTALGNASTGSGSIVLATSPTLVTPNLGTPSAGVLTNATGLPLTTGVTGTLAISHGGTGATAAAAAFDALSPLTTAGDLVYGGAAGTGLRLAAGTTNQVLIGGATPSWGAVNLSNMASGTLQASQFPALSGDVTTSAGSLVTSISTAAGSGFSKYTAFVTNETPSGSVNGINTAFTLATTPATGFGGISTLQLELNGQSLEAGAGNDYTLSAANVTMLFAPQTGDKLRAYYMR
jgi:hypothetical protein